MTVPELVREDAEDAVQPVREDAVPPLDAVLLPPVVDYPEDGSVRPVERFVWEPVETAQLPVDSASCLRGRSIAVVGGSERTAAAVAAELAEAGAAVHRLAPPLSAESGAPAESVARFRAGVERIDGIIDLNLENPLDVTGPGGWEPALHQSIGLLQSCYADWVAETDATRLFYCVVTRMGGHMGFSPGRMSQPLGGLWAGLAKGLPRELPNCNIKILDLAPEHHDGAAGLIRRELYRWGAFEIGYRGGRRYTLQARSAEPGPPSKPLRPGDVVVMSGGGRGIGFALARALARNFGARVIVSGRGAPPAVTADRGGELPVTMPPEAFRRYRDQQLRQAAADRRLPEVRARLEKLEQERELWANLAAAREEGLRIEYVQCDITDPDQVTRLLDEAGDRLAGIVHNAGVDIPVRLPAKTAEVVGKVVQVKVQGFVNLLRAAELRPALSFFCNVGSLTGRWGGMVGQLDYGAANEGLSRLGLWAAQSGEQPGRRRRLPVTTVCWPTWERLGMITNYEATLRYMSAVDISEGLYHWQRELLADRSGEATFIGDVGSAMLPVVLRGYQQDSGLPGIDRLASSRFYLGRPQRFRPFEAISTVNVLRAEEMPCCDDFRVDGEPALPVGLCLEFMLSTGEWVLPEQADQLRLAELRDIVVELPALRAGPRRPVINLVKDAQGSWADGCWLVSVVIRRDGEQLARARLVYQPGDLANQPGNLADPPGAASPPPAAMPATTPAEVTPTVLEPVPVPSPAASAEDALRWNGHAFRLTSWDRDLRTGRLHGEAPTGRMADLLVTSPPPRSVLPLNQIENLVRAAWIRRAAAGGPARPARLAIERLRLPHPAGEEGSRLSGDPDCRDWTIHDPAGRPRLHVDGLRIH